MTKLFFFSLLTMGLLFSSCAHKSKCKNSKKCALKSKKCSLKASQKAKKTCSKSHSKK